MTPPGSVDELVAFMRTLRPPPGDTAAALLMRYDERLNAGGPAARVRRGVDIDTIDGWRLSADIHLPEESGPCPLLIYLHGGGWVMGTPGTHDRMAREFAAAGFVTVSVDYPRAPKWPFPAGFDGCLRALRWAIETAATYGADPSRVALAGDSAGANLAAAVAVAAAAEGIDIASAALMYGIYDYHRALPALAHVVGGESAASQQYVPSEVYAELTADPRLNPEVSAAQLPPCWIGVGSNDPLAAESMSLAAALARAGVSHELYLAAGSPHSFLQMPFDAAYDPGWLAMLRFLHARG